MDTRIAVVSLWAEDVITTAHFYHDVLGLKLSAHHGGMPHFDVNGIVLVFLKGRPSPAEESHPPDFPILAFEVENIDLMIDRLQKHGVDLPWGLEQRTGSRWIKFYDPGGNLIELVSYEQ